MAVAAVASNRASAAPHDKRRKTGMVPRRSTSCARSSSSSGPSCRPPRRLRTCRMRGMQHSRSARRSSRERSPPKTPRTRARSSPQGDDRRSDVSAMSVAIVSESTRAVAARVPAKRHAALPRRAARRVAQTATSEMERSPPHRVARCAGPASPASSRSSPSALRGRASSLALGGAASVLVVSEELHCADGASVHDSTRERG